MSRLIWPTVLVGLCGGPLMVRAEQPSLIPRKVLFGNPAKASPRISPCGKRLAYGAPDLNNVLQVWVQTLGQDDARKVTSEKARGIRTYSWTYDPNTLIYLQDPGADDNFHLYAVDIRPDQKKRARDLTPYRGVQVRPMGGHRDFAEQLLVTMNRRNPRTFDVYRINLKSGELQLDTRNPGNVVSWSTDNNFRVRIAKVPTKDGGKDIFYRKDDRSPWTRLLRLAPEDESSGVMGFTRDNRSLYLLSSAGRDTLALVRRDLASGKETVLASDPQADVADLILHPRTREVEAVAFNREKVRWQVLDRAIAADLKALDQGAPGQWDIISRDRQWKRWVVSYASDQVPETYYLYDRPTRKLTKLFCAHPELGLYKLAKMKPVTIRSRDGLDLVSYLTLPVGVPAKKLPLVLLVHDRAWSRNTWGYDAQAQWLANRGYAVLQVNFRGSRGFGKTFLDAGNREWGGKMQDDLIDGVNWAVKNGYADPKKVAIMGRCYGGYAALVGAAFTPDVFCCAVSEAAPSNLITLLRSIPPSYELLRKTFEMRVGELADESFLAARSPLFRADKIKVPVLIAQGALDQRVHPQESEQLVSAIRKAGNKVEYLLFRDEGHTLVRPDNRVRYAAAVEKFLATHLGGRYEPLSDHELTRR